MPYFCFASSPRNYISFVGRKIVISNLDGSHGYDFEDLPFLGAGI